MQIAMSKAPKTSPRMVSSRPIAIKVDLFTLVFVQRGREANGM